MQNEADYIFYFLTFYAVCKKAYVEKHTSCKLILKLL